jgi:hypothetical protein
VQMMLPLGSMGTLKRAGMGAMIGFGGSDRLKSDGSVYVMKSNNGAETDPRSKQCRDKASRIQGLAQFACEVSST